MRLQDYAIDLFFLVRAYEQCYQELDDHFDGGKRDLFEASIAKLQDCTALVMRACREDVKDEISVEPKDYEGKDALIVTTSDHKFVFYRMDQSSETYRAMRIYPR